MFSLRAKMFNKRAQKGAKEVLKCLEIQAGNVVADLGSGGGYFTYAFSELVGSGGMVYAIDTDKTLLAYVKKQITKKQLTNVKQITASEKSSNLPENSCDPIFLRSIFHHIANPVVYFEQLSKSLKPNGRIAIIDWKPGASRFGHSTPQEKIHSVMHTVGYKSHKTFEFLDKQSFIIFKR